MSEQREALAEADHCHGLVTHYGIEDACGKPPVAIIDGRSTEDEGYWPACAYHAHRYGRGNVVPLARLLADAEQRGADRVAAALLSARVVCPVHGIPDCGPLLNGCQIPRYIAEWRGEFLADLRAALTTGAADRVRAEEVPAQAESLHEELLRADDDADQLRAVIFRLAEDVTRLKRVCHQEHPLKMGSPTRDWPAGTETRHSDGARCVLLNDGDYTLIHSPEQDDDQ